jgi:aldehyde dehydrogenase (NAD(P)+)
MLVTATGWAQRDKFLDLVAQGLAQAPTRKAYYPGAFERYERLLAGHSNVERFGQGSPERLQWAMVRGLDSSQEDPLFRTEPFCGILSETSIASPDPLDFLDTATTFINERMWGTLSAMLVVPPKLEKDPGVARELDRTVADLRYGTVAINHWPALCYAVGTMPWGGHPSASLKDIQSGLGWVHNTYMLGGVDKSVVRGPLTVSPYPAWFFDNPKAARIAPAAADMEAAPSWLKLPGLLAKVLL